MLDKEEQHYTVKVIDFQGLRSWSLERSATFTHAKDAEGNIQITSVIR